MKKKLIVMLVVSVIAFSSAAPPAMASGKEYSRIVRHLKERYKAKKVSIPFMFLARFAVKVVRPAGVKSFSVTVFEDLQFPAETLDAEMQKIMRESYGPEWTPLLRVRSKTGEQVYMYVRESGSNVKLAMVTIDRQEASVIRATVDPVKLAEFINNPKIFGVSLDDGNKAE